jgi:AraC-like DNA-binding protein
MKLIILVLLLVFFNHNCFCQNAHFDSIYEKIGRELENTDPEKSLNNVDYLYSISKNDNERLRSLILKAAFLMHCGLNDEAQIIFFEAEELAQKNKNYQALTSIYGYISSIYRESGLYASSLKYLEKASQSSGKIEENDVRWRFKGNIIQEKGNIKMEKGNYIESIVLIRASYKYFLKIKSNTEIDIYNHLARTNGVISKNYLLLNEIDSSFYYLAKAKENLAKSDIIIRPLEGFLFNGLAEAYLANKSYDKAEENFLKAKIIADETNNFDLKKDVYKSMCNFYKELGRNEKFIAFNEQYLKLIEQDQRSKKLVADKLLNNLYDQQIYLEANEHIKTRTIILLIIFSILLVALLIWYIYKKRQNQKKFQSFINELDKNKDIITDTDNEFFIPEPDNNKSYMSKEKELIILKDLEKFEKTEFYLNKDISLGVFSGKMGTNQRYLTHVIKKYKNADFATYINELKINYIVKRIKSNPKYLMYKISYLAEECGFSYHSRFTINFKKVTGTTPSAFIAYVKEENERMKKNE